MTEAHTDAAAAPAGLSEPDSLLGIAGQRRGADSPFLAAIEEQEPYAVTARTYGEVRARASALVPGPAAARLFDAAQIKPVISVEGAKPPPGGGPRPTRASVHDELSQTPLQCDVWLPVIVAVNVLVAHRQHPDCLEGPAAFTERREARWQ